MKARTSFTIDADVVAKLDSLVDNIYYRSKSEAVEDILRKYFEKQNTAIILCGGEFKVNGTDYYRPLVKVGDTTVIDHIISKLRVNNFRSIGITTAGMVADLQAMVRLMRSELTLYEIRSGSKLDTDGAVSLLSAVLFNKRLSLNLIYGEFIVGGYDTAPKLFSIDEAGGQGKDKFTVTGSGGVFALGVQ